MDTPPSPGNESCPAVSTSHGTSENASEEDTAQGDDVYDPPVTGTYKDGSTPEFSGVKPGLTIDGEKVVIAMYDNTAADTLLERLPMEDLSSICLELKNLLGDVRYLPELVPLGKVENGLDFLSNKKQDFTGTFALMEME